MKKLLLLTFVFSISLLLNAQDRIFNYKALITDNGNPLANQDVTIKFTILKGGSTNVYQEENLATTDENGIVSVGLGGGMNPSGDFSAINWGDGSYYLKVEIDTGNGFLDFGTNEFLSVPYAKHAYKADSVNHIDYNKISNAPVTFYKVGTSNDLPANINDDIYHSGKMIIGGPENISTLQHKLNVYNRNNTDEGHSDISVSLAAVNGNLCYGTHNSLTSDINNTLYGTYNTVNGLGDSNKYGSYNYIPETSGGQHFAVYGHSTKAGSYAGYFEGDVHISNKLKTTTSGDADMKAYVYGLVLYDGKVITDRSSDGFNVEYISTGLYKITLTDLSASDDHYIVSASTEYSATVVITNVDYADFGGTTEANVFYIREFDLSGTPVNNSFHFVVYRK